MYKVFSLTIFSFSKVAYILHTIVGRISWYIIFHLKNKMPKPYKINKHYILYYMTLASILTRPYAYDVIIAHGRAIS